MSYLSWRAHPPLATEQAPSSGGLFSPLAHRIWEVSQKHMNLRDGRDTWSHLITLQQRKQKLRWTEQILQVKVRRSKQWQATFKQEQNPLALCLVPLPSCSHWGDHTHRATSSNDSNHTQKHNSVSRLKHNIWTHGLETGVVTNPASHWRMTPVGKGKPCDTGAKWRGHSLGTSSSQVWVIKATQNPPFDKYPVILEVRANLTSHRKRRNPSEWRKKLWLLKGSSSRRGNKGQGPSKPIGCIQGWKEPVEWIWGLSS